MTLLAKTIALYNNYVAQYETGFTEGKELRLNHGAELFSREIGDQYGRDELFSIALSGLPAMTEESAIDVILRANNIYINTDDSMEDDDGGIVDDDRAIFVLESSLKAFLSNAHRPYGEDEDEEDFDD